ncbi:MAG: hypothetical protein AAF462_07580 [Thermodesulfobacteriota bacterium]
MSETDKKLESKKDEHCIECPIGLDDCVECGACDHCDHDAMLNESELPPNWLTFIEKSKPQSNS